MPGIASPPVLGVEPPAPDSMLGAMATLPLPDVDPYEAEPLHERLFERHAIEVPAFPWPVPAALEGDRPPSGGYIRISAQLYNEPADYDRLAEALAQELRGGQALERRVPHA